MLIQWKGDVLLDTHAVKQRRILKHKTKSPSQLGQLRFRKRFQIATIKPYRSLRRRQQPHKRLEQHRLATSTLPNDRYGLTPWDR